MKCQITAIYSEMYQIIGTQLATMSLQDSLLPSVNGTEESEEQLMKKAALNFFRRNISLAGKGCMCLNVILLLICKNLDTSSSPEAQGARQLFGFTLKHGMQWLRSDDQSFLSAVEIFSQGKIEKSLTAFCASDTAKLLGKTNVMFPLIDNAD